MTVFVVLEGIKTSVYTVVITVLNVLVVIVDGIAYILDKIIPDSLSLPDFGKILSAIKFEIPDFKNLIPNFLDKLDPRDFLSGLLCDD